MESAGFRPKSPYQTLILGTPFSGKTVLLSSLYKRLSVSQPQEGTSFYLSSTAGQGLLRQYHGMEVEKKWPERTKDFESYLFNLRTNIDTRDTNGNLVSEPCDHLAYKFHDIPGQSLTDRDADPAWAERVENLADCADSFLVLIDGYQVLRSINEVSDVGLYSQLDYILPIIQRISGKPLHFVITKWDLIENNASLSEVPSEQLAIVREKLLNNISFADIVKQQKALKAPTRLLPISAVGKKFAILDGEKIRIDPKAIPAPSLVELPLALLLWDKLRLLHKQHAGSLKGKKSTVTNLKGLRKFLDISTQAVDKIPVTPGLLPPKLVLSFGLSGLKSVFDSVIPKQEGILGQMTLQEKDLQQVLREFITIVNKFERDFPASKLVDIDL